MSQPEKKRLLVVCHHVPLGQTRAAVLRSAHYSVELMHSEDAALLLENMQLFDLVVIGRTSARTQRPLDESLRRKYPNLLILKLDGTPSAFASVTIQTSPANYLSVVRDMLGLKPQPIPLTSGAEEPTQVRFAACGDQAHKIS